jgi:PTS system beta-glucosides-specific IIC component
MATAATTQTAEDVIARLGGPKNITQVTHCATRLRTVVKDTSKVDKAALEKTPGVLSVIEAGGQMQVVIGSDVPNVYKAILVAHPQYDEESGSRVAGERGAAHGNVVTRFVEVVSSIFVPTLGVLAGTGLFKAFLALAFQLNWLDSESSTAVILTAASDAFFYSLPVMLAYTTARRFKADILTSMALGAALVYPALVTLMSGDAPADFFGIPVQRFSYASSVIPIILAVWAMSHLERWLGRVIPVMLRKFVVPPLCLLIMLPLVLVVVGPVTLILGNGLASAISWLFSVAPPFGAAIGGGLFGGVHQAIVIFGLHWGIIPVMIQEVSTKGYSLILAPVLAAVLGQSAAALAVAMRTRSRDLRTLAVSAAVSGFLAGITEPAIYGVNLRLKRPFIAGCVGGLVGGAVISAGGVAPTSFVFPCLLALPAFMGHGSVPMLLLGCGLAIVVAFTLTLVLRFEEPADAAATPASGAVVQPTAQHSVAAPVAGTVVAMPNLPDKVFASGAMGTCVGIVPESDDFVAPVAGTVVTVMESGHAYGLMSDSGVEVLVHIGIDTVQLKGQHFRPVVARGTHVSVGDLLGHADVTAIAEAGYDVTTVVAVTNTNQLADVHAVAAEHVKAGEPVLAANQATADAGEMAGAGK